MSDVLRGWLYGPAVPVEDCALPLHPYPSAAAQQRGAPVLQQEPSPGHRGCVPFHWGQPRHKSGTQTACPSPKTR